MRRLLQQTVVQFLCALALAVCWPTLRAGAQAAGPPQTEKRHAPPAAPVTADAGQATSQDSSGDDASGDVETIFPHTLTGRYWISGQANVILQGYEAFKAEYSGPNSLTNWSQSATTHLLTLYTGYELSQSTEVFADIEDATGNGVGNEVGLAGYVNLDAVRCWRACRRRMSPTCTVDAARDHSADERASESRPRRAGSGYLDSGAAAGVAAGKMDLTDFFDVNTYGSDSNLQFLNWTVDDNGAWDVASNARGYTEAVDRGV